MASSMASMVAAIHTTTAATENYPSGGVTSLPSQQQSLASNTSLIEAAAECTPEIKTEFYTREGLWRLVKNSGEYARQIVISQQQQFQPQQQLTTAGSTSTSSTNNTASGQATSQNGSTTNLNGSPIVVNIAQVPTTVTSNEPVHAKLFRFSKRLLIQDSFLSGAYLENLPKQLNETIIKLCKKCLNEQTVVRDAYDDDDDVVYMKFNRSNSKCGSSGGVKFTLSDSTVKAEQQNPCCSNCGCVSTNLVECEAGKADDNHEENQLKRIEMSPRLDLLVFNYSKEIYTYEFNNPVKALKSSSDMSRNLIDKKIYKTYVSSCMDINLMASTLNTKALQLMYNSTAQQQQPHTSPSIIMSPVTAGTTNILSPSTSSKSTPIISSTSPQNILNENFKFSLSPSNLSLIVAAGFSKGEIHVFDVFKKDASVFYNNSKLVDKTKVTCIKWLPNSVNLFLVAYSSGNIYLYDANIQAQATVPPAYTKYIQTDAYSVFLNSLSDQVTSNSTPSSAASSANLASNASTSGLNKGQQSQQPIYNALLNQQQKLLQLNSSNGSQPVQVAKNPLMRIKIGECPPNMLQQLQQAQQQSSADSSASWELSGCGVNEFAFSPCGQYLAVVSQDGYLRIFYFVYDTATTTTTTSSGSGTSSTPLQIQLRCSMKSYFGGLLCVCWSHDGRYVATGGEDDLITVFAFSDGMRVACRGRGHSSWINGVAFDPWTVLPNSSSDPFDDDYGDDTDTTSSDNKLNRKKDSSPGADVQAEKKDTSPSLSSKQQQIEKQLDQLEEANKYTRGLKVTGPKQRTISTLSDYNMNSNHGDVENSNQHRYRHRYRQQSQLNSAESRALIYYRLASIGQDNQVCFWDLTEDILRASAIQSRSRMATSSSATVASISSQQQPVPQQQPVESSQQLTKNPIFNGGKLGHHHHHHHHHHHSAASSIVSTARNLFSKHSDKSNTSSNKYDQTSTDGEESTISKTSSLASGIFRKHKRNAIVNNSANITNSAIDQSAQALGKSSKYGSSSKGSQVTLNSYKKSSSNADTDSIVTAATTTTTSGIIADNSSLASSISKQKGSSAKLNVTYSIPPIMADHGQFNLCPKLDHVPFIEPLICKCIANERLTSISFRDDCFIVSTQDGFVYTWARPSKETRNKIAKETRITTSL